MKTEEWEPLRFREAFRFPVSTAGGRRDVFTGGTLLLIPIVGWILNLGHRLDVVWRLAHDEPPYFRGFMPWGRTFRRGLRAFGAILLYLTPSVLVTLGAAVLFKVEAYGGAAMVAAFGLVLFGLAIYALPGGMTYNAAYDDMRYLYRPDLAFARAVNGGKRYVWSWVIAIAAVTFSFAGLLLLGVGFLYGSVWAWSVVGYAFSRALILPVAVVPGDTADESHVHDAADMVIVEHVVKDGLYIGARLDDYQPTKVWWYRLPSSWVTENDLTDDARERIFANLYGATWRSGNDDGSRYVVLDETVNILTPPQIETEPWLERGAGYYHFSDGRLKYVDGDEFGKSRQ